MTDLTQLSEPRSTFRDVAPQIEPFINVKLPVFGIELGYVKLLDYMGNDRTIARSARTSAGGKEHTEKQDHRLIRYMMQNMHTTPFEMCELRIEVCLPIFIARQWVRHRTASINEISGRMTELTEFHLPWVNDIKGSPDPGQSRQGRHSHTLSDDDASLARDTIAGVSKTAFLAYQELLRAGVAKEIARMVLPLNTMTTWVWKCDLHNIFHFLDLRLDQHAQYEIRVYAETLEMLVACWVPVAFSAWKEFQPQRLALLRKEGDS